MKLTFIANACCIYESKGFRILSDPWLTDGAFEGAWAHFPPVTTTVEDLLGVNALYISHLHPDHYSKPDMDRFPRHIPIIYLDQEPNYLRKVLKKDGFTNLIGIKDLETVALGPFELTMYKAWCLNPFQTGAMGNPLDSALVLRDKDHCVLNTNDATPTLPACRFLKSKHGHFDIAQLQFNGAGPFPACFGQTPQQASKHHYKLIERNLDYLVDMAAILKPRYTMPFAGQYIIQGKKWRLNKYLGTTTPWEAAIWLKKNRFKPMVLLDGQTVDLSFPYRRPLVAQWKAKNQLLYAKKLADRPYSYEADSEPDSSWLFSAMVDARAKVFQACKKFDVWPDCNVSINGFEFFMQPFCMSPSNNSLRCTLDNRLLARILRGQAHWNNCEIGLHIEFQRVGPYIPDVHMLLSFFHV